MLFGEVVVDDIGVGNPSELNESGKLDEKHNKGNNQTNRKTD